MKTEWRFMDTGPLDGPGNMALDEALLSCFDPLNSRPVFRIYGWSPPAFSVGKFQRPGDVLDLDRCARDRVPVVRRVTGGGCIFHADELTYSIVCAPEHLAGVEGVKESYRKLCGFLLIAYRKLGLEPAFAVESDHVSQRLGERTSLCFAGKEEYDITVRGRKLGGNAQRRTRGIIFQHGSIPLRDSLAAAAPYLRADVGAAGGAASLEDFGISDSAELIKGRLAEAFAENLGIELTLTEPGEWEHRMSAMLLETKYRADAWNLEMMER